MPAVTPAEQHTRHTYGVAECLPPRTPARSTSTRRPLFSISVFSVFSVVCFSPCPPCPPWFAFSVPSMSCPMWGRLSSLRPAFQPALVPFTHRPTCNRTVTTVGAAQPVRPFSSDLRALPCSRKGAVPRGASRQACHAGGHAGRATQSRAVREFQRLPPPRLAAWPARLRAPLPRVARTPARSASSRPFFSHLRVLRVLRGLLFSVFSVFRGRPERS